MTENPTGQPKIVIFEDDPNVLKAIVRQMTMIGIAVVGTASTMEAALELISQLKEIGAQFALVDGHLSPTSKNGDDGKTINDAIKEIEGESKIVTIGFSAEPQPWVDIDLTKNGYTIKSISAIVFKRE